MQNIKDVYRKIAKLAHPDLVTDHSEKNSRTLLMSEVNQAYENNDINKLIKILKNLEENNLNKIDFVKKDIRINEKIVFTVGIVTQEESLPHSYVHYPGAYGYFMGFAKTESSPVYLCDCTIKSVKNLFNLSKNIKIKYKYYGNYIDERIFPQIIANEFIKNQHYQPQFKPLLCHKCQYNFQKINISTGGKSNEIQTYKSLVIQPSLRYCHKMYGTKFTQQYGWYVEQTYLRFGIYPPIGNTVATLEYGLEFLPDICPIKYQQDMRNIMNGKKKLREFTREIENITREEFEFKKLPDK